MTVGTEPEPRQRPEPAPVSEKGLTWNANSNRDSVLGGHVHQPCVGCAKPSDRGFNLASLTFEMVDLCDYLLRLELLFEIFGLVLRADEFANFGKGETELLALDDHLKSHPVSGPVDA